MAITKDGRRIMVDLHNKKVKSFSKDMNFLSFVSVPVGTTSDGTLLPGDIVLISEKKAAVSTGNTLVIINISSTQLRVKKTIKLSNHVLGITQYKEKLVITSFRNQCSVKLINLTGEVYWSVSFDQQQPSFEKHLYVSSHYDGSISSVIVSNYYNNMLTVLNGDTGKTITRRKAARKKPRGITTDRAGNVYVCNYGTREVSVMTRDLTMERILMSSEDGLSSGPSTIAYDDRQKQLIISYGGHSFTGSNIVDVFKLSCTLIPGPQHEKTTINFRSDLASA